MLKEILENKNTLIPNANLLATSNIKPDSIISSNSSMGHNSIPKKSSTGVSKFNDNIGQVAVGKTSTAQLSFNQSCTGQINTFHHAANKYNAKVFFPVIVLQKKKQCFYRT